MKPECNFRQLKYNSARLAIMKYIAETGIQVGDRLPPERKLVKRLSCSAITMRHALADMESVGLISPRHGSGTYLTKEIRNEKFSWNILYIFVNRKGYENAGERQNILRDYRAEHGIGLSCVSITEFSMELLNAAEGCIGIIVSGWLTDSIIRSLLTLKLPLVVCGNNKLTLEVPSVTVNAEEGACRMTRIMLANGQRKIGIIHAEEGYYFGEHSKNWYCRAMKEAGFQSIIPQVPERCSYAEKVRALMTEYPDVEGILLEEDALLELVSWIWDAGYPKHPVIGLLSSEYKEFSLQQRKNMISVSYANLSLRAAQLLVEHLADGTQLESVVLDPEIPGYDEKKQTAAEKRSHINMLCSMDKNAILSDKPDTKRGLQP